MTYDFRAWLNVQPDDKPYQFIDASGNCAIGQYMTSRGEKWTWPGYNKHLKENFIGLKPLIKSQTLGELKQKLLELA